MPRGGVPAAAPAAGALPLFFEYEASRDWKAIDFISDLHLSAAMPRTFAAFSDHLRRTTADAVFILGDLFDVWVGDDAAALPFERQCIDVLAEASSHRTVAFMVGNRDFLFGTTALRAGGMLGLPDPTLLLAWGQRVLLSHGDALCLDDLPYQRFRAEVRSDAWRQAFLDKPLVKRLAIAAGMRRESSARQRTDGNVAVDVDPAAAVQWLHATGAAELVHGHTHRPGSESLAPGHKRHVLSDWDLDDGDRAEVLRLTRDGFSRVAPRGAFGAPTPGGDGGGPAEPGRRRPLG